MRIRPRSAPLRWRAWLRVQLHCLAWLWRGTKRASWLLAEVAFVIVLVLVGLFSLANFTVSTPRVGAYRTLHPAVAACREGLTKGWTALAESDATATVGAEPVDDDGWVDPSNNELQLVAADQGWATKLRCALQKHVVPSKISPDRTLTYYLDFLEFKENGDPYPLVRIDPKGNDAIPTPEMIGPLPEKPGSTTLLTQLDVLKQHLSVGSNYVLVFIHGWRHDASIGDGNVTDIRHYAAHAARFLKRRCELEHRYCDMTVTAVFVGWRGARVDETKLKTLLGHDIGGMVGNIAAGATLFDRKPVSEEVAPGAISALRAVERILSPTYIDGTPKPGSHINRMIVFGHSLGGNMLATGLQDDLVKMVDRHVPGRLVPPVLGDLTVLINPASEASKWTAVQRAVWKRIPFHIDADTSKDDVAAGNHFFRIDQKPVIVSVTSALAFPPGGLRTSDCEWFSLQTEEKMKVIAKVGRGEGKVDYDWATEDLFPTFKFDFRPASLLMERLEASIEGQPHAPGQSCDHWIHPSLWHRIESRPFHWVSLFLANFPFQTTDKEQSHTIGHLDPPRPTDGRLMEKDVTSASPFGTTHELFGLQNRGKEKHNPYASLADAPIECEPSNGWLIRARMAEQAKPNATFWDSQYLGPGSPGGIGEGPPAAHFLHGAYLSGEAAITRANDPFWNMRAFDNALSRHDGYRLSSFICAMNQLVMDDITAPPPPAEPAPMAVSMTPAH